MRAATLALLFAGAYAAELGCNAGHDCNIVLPCCSERGFCGLDCGPGCQPAFSYGGACALPPPVCGADVGVCGDAASPCCSADAQCGERVGEWGGREEVP